MPLFPSFRSYASWQAGTSHVYSFGINAERNVFYWGYDRLVDLVVLVDRWGRGNGKPDDPTECQYNSNYHHDLRWTQVVSR